MELIRYDTACKAIAEARNVDEAKDISDKAQALQAYAKQANNPELEQMAAEIRLRAKRRIGELARALESKQGQRTDKLIRGTANKLPDEPPPADGKMAALKQAGITKDQASKCEAIARVPVEEFEQYIGEMKESGRTVSSDQIAKRVTAREGRERKIEKIISKNEALPSARYPVIYADPPWQYEHHQVDHQAIENHYPTMTLADIKALPVPGIASDPSILFLWTTAPKIGEALEVMTAWGFVYRSSAIWDKEVLGMGYYFRIQHELLFVGTRGEMPTPLPEHRPRSVIREKRGKHSAKPDIVAEQIAAMYPELQRIELFSRTAREGWHAWGNQSET